MKLPYQIHKPTEAVIVSAMTAVSAASFYYYSRFPARVPTHWNIAGTPDGWSGPAFAAFFVPVLIVAMYLLLTFLPAVDPNKERYEEFGRPYGILRLSFVLFMCATYFVASLAGLGYNISINVAVPFGIGLLFIVIGNYMPKFRKNWFVGIRTPWTLSDENVWNRTHRAGGKIFMASGLLMMTAGLFGPTWSVMVLITSVSPMTVGTMGYSYWIWKKSRADDGTGEHEAKSSNKNG